MPIRLRLALWYGTLTGIVLVLVSLTTYALHTRAHYDDLDRVMVRASEHLADEYQQATTADEVDRLFSSPVAPDLVAELYRPDGSQISASANARLAPVVDPAVVLANPAGHPYGGVVRLAPPLVDVHATRGAFGLATADDGVRWRLYVLPVSGADALLLTAAPLDRIDASVARFRWLVIALSAVGAVGTLVAGALLAGRALRPVALLTRTAAGIEHTRAFGRRVPITNPRDELGHLATTFNAMLASLEESYRAQQRFVSDASHELRAPLTIIQANLDFLEHRPDLADSERREVIGEASQEARRLANLVADLLALARADAGIELQRQPVELDRVLLDAVADARHLARGQQLEVEALEPVVVAGDPDRLKQLLIALLDNAIKYTPPGRRVAVSLRRTGLHAELAVHDEGVGISPEDLPHVFERFYRADPARSRDPGGTGLGLSIARWIAEQHGGSIRITSELGRGTRVVVQVPLRS